MEREKEIFFEHLKREGFKKTSQREKILEVFLRTDGHSSAEDLYTLVRSEDPTVGFTTVYRTLKLLTECGLARQEKFADGFTRYEQSFETEHHDHLICTNCGTLIEFFSEVIENKQDEIARKFKFKPTHHSLRIFGVCEACQQKQTAVAS